MGVNRPGNPEDFMKGNFGFAGTLLETLTRCHSRAGIMKGQHWHNSKWEQFIVVHGHGLIQERNIVTGDQIEAVYMIPGWTHNIINLSDTEDLVTVMTCKEVFNPEKPDTYFEKV